MKNKSNDDDDDNDLLKNKGWRLGNCSAQELMVLMKILDPLMLSEFTTAGRPTGVAPIHLICGGADKEAERCTILLEMLRLSASPSLKIKGTGATPLHRAAGSGATEIVKVLIGVRAHVNATNDIGNTPLDVAVRCSSKVCRG